MPDLHPGKGYPIGATIGTEDILYPPLIGNDVGCGMRLVETSMKRRNAKPQKIASKLFGLESRWEGDPASWQQEGSFSATKFDAHLGTIGGGNHFAELQEVEEIVDEEACSRLAIHAEHLYLLVHSGSRGFGDEILRSHLDKFGTSGLVVGSQEANEYLAMHDHACAWARANRSIIVHRIMEMLGETVQNVVLDIWHNNVEEKTLGDGRKLLLHRKGAAPSDRGAVVIPGSRGAYSYLVEPVSLPDHEKSGFSLAHGAGRKMTRTKALSKLREKYRSSTEALTETKFGGVVVCEDKELLFEEAPEAYKDVEEIVEDLVEEGLVNVVAILRPIVTYKTR